jgi:hypothetical protein
LLKEDPYLESLATIVGNSLSREPDGERMKQESDEAQLRIDNKRPPGFRDASKPIPQRYGDAFIWFDLVRLAADRKRPIMFVTDDDKDDWWLIVEGQKLGARPVGRLDANGNFVSAM